MPLGVNLSSESFCVHGSISEKTLSSRRRRVILHARASVSVIAYPGGAWMGDTRLPGAVAKPPEPGQQRL
jgi:hypothetical protein